MKKIIAVLVLCALVVCGAAADERSFDLNLGFGGLTDTITNGTVYRDYKFQGITFGFTSTTMYSKFIGMSSDVNIERPSKLTISDGSNSVSANNVNASDLGFQMDMSFGLAIRPYSANGINLYIIPNVGMYFWFPPASALGSVNPNELLGFGVDVAVKFSPVDGIGIMAGLDFDYYTMDLAAEIAGSSTTTYGIEEHWTLLNPKIGISFSF
ncbi:MAG: hypothetical protein KBT02_11670 [Treponema sp.]|nr:hypothetical protein [Candidatus Treponema caballi]